MWRRRINGEAQAGVATRTETPPALLILRAIILVNTLMTMARRPNFYNAILNLTKAMTILRYGFLLCGNLIVHKTAFTLSNASLRRDTIFIINRACSLVHMLDLRHRVVFFGTHDQAFWKAGTVYNKLSLEHLVGDRGNWSFVGLHKTFWVHVLQLQYIATWSMVLNLLPEAFFLLSKALVLLTTALFVFNKAMLPLIKGLELPIKVLLLRTKAQIAFPMALFTLRDITPLLTPTLSAMIVYGCKAVSLSPSQSGFSDRRLEQDLTATISNLCYQFILLGIGCFFLWKMIIGKRETQGDIIFLIFIIRPCRWSR